ncbi:hypothetical protein AAEU33_00285 [Chryseobacterium sp. Chry.R1]|uniref:hypothetical protein n=1 Tax=Chryseobacterium sp. Chry.R1 TaxID=3139392 RepID=UPI00279C0E17|nr:hypothetical protein PFY10_18175 [Chryseobacterium daecheongense]
MLPIPEHTYGISFRLSQKPGRFIKDLQMCTLPIRPYSDHIIADEAHDILM